MHRLIKIRYNFFAIALFFTYYLWAIYSVINDQKLSFSLIEDDPSRALLIHLYIMTWLFIGGFLLREYILYRKIKCYDVKEIYPIQEKALVFKVLAQLLSHAVFLYMIYTGMAMLIPIISVGIFTTIPNIVSGRIYVGQDHFIYNGCKYLYKNIDMFRGEAFYRILVMIKDKEHSLKAGTYDRYKVLMGLLENNTKLNLHNHSVEL